MTAVDALVRETQGRLAGLARPASGHPASGGFGSGQRRLGLGTQELRAAARELARGCRALAPREVVRVALALATDGTFEGGLVACLLLERDHRAAGTLGARDLARLAGRPDNWVTTDTFGCMVSGPAWRRGRVDDALIARWARSRDRWWRRIALVSTVPLNLPSRGGSGDVPRTLRICRMLAADHDDMVAKALSWALREAAKRDPAATRRFLERQRAVLAARVVREVTNKLTTGLKSPPGGRSVGAVAARRRAGRGANAGTGARRAGAAATGRSARPAPPRRRSR
jgi:3-methyladenine DNA glycosylase AlkD